jgi:hypothetical protein
LTTNETTTTDGEPQSFDLDMRANADVRWANPDALTREQLIRSHAVSVAVARLGQSLSEPPGRAIGGLIAAASGLAAWIRDGSAGAE